MSTKIIENKKKDVKMGKWLLLAIVPLLIFSSCSNDRNDIIGSVKNKDPKVTIDFSGTSKVGEAQTRYFTITPEIKGAEASRSYNAKLNYLSRDGQTIQVRFALIAVSPSGVIQNRDSFVANAIVKVTDKEKNEADLEFPKQEIYLKKSIVDDKQSKWYVSGIIGARGDFNQDYGIEFSQTQNTTTYSIQGGKITGSPITDDTGISAYSGEQNGRVQVYNVPIICPWTEVNRHNLEAQQSFRLKTTFDPQGMLIAFNIKSELHDAAILTDLEITTNAFTSNVTFNFGAFDPNSQDSQTPTVINNGTSMNIGGYHSDFGYINTYKIANVEVDPNHPTQIYIWVMPMNGGGNLEGHTTPASGANGVIVIRNKAISKVSVTNKTIQPTSNKRYIESIPYSPIEQVITNVASHIQNGHSLTINTKLQSDLMITEYLQFDNDGNKGILELYNPTNHSIDLSNYKLVRTEGVARVNDEYKTYYFQGEGYKGRDTILEKAIPQDLYINHTGEPYGNVTHLNGDPWGNNCNRRKNMYKDNQPNTQMLEPGKCILVFAGYYVQKDAKPTADILNNINTNIYSDRIQSNVDNGKCQIAVAFDNGITLNGWSNDVNAGTMQKQRNQGFLLVKGKKPIDTFAPGPSANQDDWTKFTRGSDQGSSILFGISPLIWVRNSYSLYPNLNFTINSLDNNGVFTNVPTNHEWFFVTEDEFNNNSKYMTPGRRSQWQ